MEGPERLKPRPEMKQQDVAEWKANPPCSESWREKRPGIFHTPEASSHSMAFTAARYAFMDDSIISVETPRPL